MEIVTALSLYKVRRAIIEGRTRALSLNDIDNLIAYNAKHEFMPYSTHAVIEGILNGIDSEAAGSNRTMH